MEVLVALTFIAVFAAGMASLAIGIVQGNAKSSNRDIATYLALDRLEAVRNTPYANINAGTFPNEGYGAVKVGNTNNPIQTFANFQRTMAFSPNTPASGMMRVVVTVSWGSGSVSEEIVVTQ